MNVYIDLLLLAIIVVSITDLSGFIDTLKHWIWKWVWRDKREYRDFSIKPIGCSYCSLHWTGLIYLIITNQFTLLFYAYLLFLCYMTPIIKDCLQMVKDICIRILDMLYTYLEL